MASAAAVKQQLIKPHISLQSNKTCFSVKHPISSSLSFTSQINGNHTNHSPKLSLIFPGHRNISMKASSKPISSADNEEGVSLGTMKLPLDTDIPRFETLLFQWANSLSQGAQLPLPVPLKSDTKFTGSNLILSSLQSGINRARYEGVYSASTFQAQRAFHLSESDRVDKIEGGVRLGFVDIDDGKTDVRVYIDCLVISDSNNSEPPVFIATRNGALKNKVPLGEPRIMKSLLAALKKSVEIARV